MLAGMVLGTLVVLSTLAWPLAWLGLELNLMCFVAGVMSEEEFKKPCMMYFVAQSIGSLSILFMGLLSEFTSTAHAFLIFSIVLKMGMMPFHFWVPVVVPFLEKLGIFLLQTWQKLAPVGLLVYCLVSKASVSVLNILLGALVMMSMTTPILVIIFSGMMNMGWVFQLQPTLLWGFLFIYYLMMVPTIKFMASKTTDFALSLLNAGGLPPFTGFVWKLKVVSSVHFKMASGMLLGSGIALASYSRMLLNHSDDKVSVSPLVSATMLVGLV